MENSLVYIIKGLDNPLLRTLTDALADHLESPATASEEEVLRIVESAGVLMIPRPEYDISDFDANELLYTLRSLVNGEEQSWAQLLQALNDSHSANYSRIKAVSPFAGDVLMFFEGSNTNVHLRPEFEERVSTEPMAHADTHEFPGNTYMVALPHEVFAQARFVDVVDEIPATV